MMSSYKRKDIEYTEGDAISPCNWSKERVEEYADKVRKLVKLQPAAPLIPVVEKFGGRISYQDISEWVNEAGSVYVHGKRDFDVLLPRYTSPMRDRFTIAHELGHYFLHSNQGEKPLVATRSGNNERTEWEANWFAAALLMPLEVFKIKCHSEGASNSTIANNFGVSIQAVKVRREVLGV